MTTVGELTTSGAVPLATVEINCVPVNVPAAVTLPVVASARNFALAVEFPPTTKSSHG